MLIVPHCKIKIPSVLQIKQTADETILNGSVGIRRARSEYGALFTTDKRGGAVRLIVSRRPDTAVASESAWAADGAAPVRLPELRQPLVHSNGAHFHTATGSLSFLGISSNTRAGAGPLTSHCGQTASRRGHRTQQSALSTLPTHSSRRCPLHTHTAVGAVHFPHLSQEASLDSHYSATD